MDVVKVSSVGETDVVAVVKVDDRVSSVEVVSVVVVVSSVVEVVSAELGPICVVTVGSVVMVCSEVVLDEVCRVVVVDEHPSHCAHSPITSS